MVLRPRKPPRSAGVAISDTTPDPKATVLAEPDAWKHRSMRSNHHLSVGTDARATQVTANKVRQTARLVSTHEHCLKKIIVCALTDIHRSAAFAVSYRRPEHRGWP